MKEKRGRGLFWAKIVGVLVIFALSFSAVSCRNSTKDAFAFREIAFCAEVTWEENGEKFCAKVHNKPSQKLQISALDASIVGEEGERYAEYVLPSALLGIKVELGENGECKMGLDKAHVSSENAKKLSLVLEAIFGLGSAEFVGEGVIEGIKCEEYLVSGELGNATYFIDNQTKFPKRIAFGGVNFDFAWVELI